MGGARRFDLMASLRACAALKNFGLSPLLRLIGALSPPAQLILRSTSLCPSTAHISRINRCISERLLTYKPLATRAAMCDTRMTARPRDKNIILQSS